MNDRIQKIMDDVPVILIIVHEKACYRNWVLVDASARREVRRSFGFAAWYTVLARRSLRS